MRAWPTPPQRRLSHPGAGGRGVPASAAAAALEVDVGRFTVAYVGLVPLALLAGAAAYALAGWLRSGGVVAVCGTLIAVSYFADVLNPLLNLPDWALALSIFHQYGRPVTDDPRWGAWLALAALAAGVMGLGVARFAHADVYIGRAGQGSEVR